MTSTQTRRANEVGQSLSPLHPCTLTPSDRDMMPNNTAKWPIARQQNKTNGVPSSATPRAKASFAAHPSSKPQGVCLNLSTAQTISNQTRFSKDTNFIKSQSFLRASLLTSTTPSNPEPKSVESLLTACATAATAPRWVPPRPD